MKRQVHYTVLFGMYFCDWYVELSKPILNEGDAEAQAETRAMTAWVLDKILVLLHPFMPFVTEELWQRLAEYGQERETMLILSEWPELSGLTDQTADEEIDWLIRLITDVRSVRSEMNVPAGARIPLVLSGANDLTVARSDRHEETIKRLARLESFMISSEMPKGAISNHY